MSVQKKGKVLAQYGRVRITEGFPDYVYEVSEPLLSEREQKVFSAFVEALSRRKPASEVARYFKSGQKEAQSTAFRKIMGLVESDGLVDRLPNDLQAERVESEVRKFFKDFAVAEDPDQMAELVYDYSVGFFEMGPLVRDAQLEEIMVNGWDKPVFVFHRTYGMCKTNISFPKEGSLTEFIGRIARTVGKHFSVREPLLDARLPDGNRANATYPYATPFGPTLTIRKFNKEPMTLPMLVDNHTVSAEVAAFLWTMMEGMSVEPMNTLFVGGTSSGKTTAMNCFADLLHYRDRVVSIEDTMEINLGDRENWVQMEARLGDQNAPALTMDGLLKNALRMRPDRILVGEVRGDEAQTLFAAMDTGHRGIIGTLHANNAKETVVRLKSAPMNVPEAMLPLLDIIVVMHREMHHGDEKKGLIRRVSHVAEVSRMDEKVLLSNIFEWDRHRDELKKTNVPSRSLEVLAQKAGVGKRDVMQEVAVRKRVLEWMVQKGMTRHDDVLRTVQGYYFNQSEVLERVARDLKEGH